jgi:N-acetylglucosamine-6-sulfatase
MLRARPSFFGRGSIAITLASAVAVLLAACTGAQPKGALGPGASPSRPNIVFVLTDDLSTNLVQYMPHVLALEHNGMSFTNYTVADSLCCPSRAAILTGEYPHDTKVFTNTPPNGGFSKFFEVGDEHKTFAVALHKAGYRTALFGKYLNRYGPREDPGHRSVSWFDSAYVPPGWSSWGGVDAGGYREYNYTIADDDIAEHRGTAPGDYLTTVLQQRSDEFIKDSAEQRKPFLLEVASFAPHAPSTPAPQDVNSFPGLQAPRGPNFGVLPKNAPFWLRHRPRLSRHKIEGLNRKFELRVESVQAVDRMIGNLELTLRRNGQAKNTVFIFSSDNGFHMGEYTLGAGKQTAFDTDIVVPLVVAGPGIPKGVQNPALAESIDLAPTFEDLAGAPVPSTVDGRSLVPLLRRQPVPAWRTVSLFEHHRRQVPPTDPDRQSAFEGAPPTYNAIRTARYTYVSYVDGEHEYYDRVRDPYELDNIYPSLSAQRRAQLDAIVGKLTSCHGPVACWAAGRPGAAGARGA